MTLTYKRLGEFISEVDERNINSSVNNLIGVTLDKIFIPSVANINGTDLSKYKIIKKNQFACSLMQVSRDNGVAISLYKKDTPSIMSPAYYVFEVTSNDILSEYLELIMCSPEFDREATFNAVGGVRGTLTWEDFCNLKINVPPMNEQQKIVNQFSKINKRKNLLNTTNEMLHNLAYCFFSEIIMDKTENAILGDLIIENKKSQIKVSEATGNFFPFFTSGEAILKDNTELSDGLNLYLNTGGQFGIHYYSGKASYSTDVWCIKGKNEYTNFLYFYILYHKDIIGSDQCFRGSALKHLKKDDMKKIPIYLPTENELQLFKRKTDEIMRLYTINQKEIECLEKLEHLLICKM